MSFEPVKQFFRTIPQSTKTAYFKVGTACKKSAQKISNSISEYKEMKEYLRDMNEQADRLAQELNQYNNKLELEDQLKTIKKHVALIEMTIKKMEEQEEN